MTSNETNLQPPATINNYVAPLPTSVPGPADIQLALAAYAQRKLAEQSWWRKSSNTVVTALGALITFATYITTTQTNLPDWAQYAFPALTLLATIIGVKNTKNGFTFTGAAELQKAALDPIVLATIQKTLNAEPYPMHAEIERLGHEAREAINAWQTDNPGFGRNA